MNALVASGLLSKQIRDAQAQAPQQEKRVNETSSYHGSSTEF